jgi:UPF0042 nucleotide-binding protein
MTSQLRIVVITGMSGAGKTTALRVLEDLGFFCVDNLPTPLVAEFARLAETRADIQQVALCIDARGRAFGKGSHQLRDELRASSYQTQLLFLDASDEALVRRFNESRRPHPLAGAGDVQSGVQAEREALWRLREQADEVIDTTVLSVHQLRRVLRERFSPGSPIGTLAVRLMSFGFRYGVPVDADLVLDARFLPNPYFVDSLKQRDGTDPDVAEYVLDHDESRRFVELCVNLLEFLIPLYRKEGKCYLTVAMGCTGGRHRSVALVEELATRLDLRDAPSIMHRDIHRQLAEQLARQEGKP